MENVDWNLYSYIIASRYRRLILKSLVERPKTPSQIAKECDLILTHVSSTLVSLTEKGAIICLTPNQRKGKIYSLTDKGKTIANTLLEET